MLRSPGMVSALPLLACLAAFGCSGPAKTSSPDAGSGYALPADRVVFDSDRTGNYEIFSMLLDGSDVQQLTHNTNDRSWWPRVSPDRHTILFYRAPAGSQEDYTKASLWVMDADGSNPREIRPAGTDGWTLQAHAEWSPDGQSLAMCGTQGGVIHVFVTDADGTNPRPVTTTGGWNCDPSWSPDGQSLLFNRCATAGCGSDPSNLDIVEAPATGGTITPLTSDGLADYDPYFSPDGTRIAWLQRVDPNANVVLGMPLGAWAIRMMNANGSNPHDLINDGEINSKPGWTLDGSRIYFHRMEPAVAVRFRLFHIDPDGSNLAEVPSTATGNSEYPTN